MWTISIYKHIDTYIHIMITPGCYSQRFWFSDSEYTLGKRSFKNPPCDSNAKQRLRSFAPGQYKFLSGGRSVCNNQEPSVCCVCSYCCCNKLQQI